MFPAIRSMAASVSSPLPPASGGSLSRHRVSGSGRPPQRARPRLRWPQSRRHLVQSVPEPRLVSPARAPPTQPSFRPVGSRLPVAPTSNLADEARNSCDSDRRDDSKLVDAPVYGRRLMVDQGLQVSCPRRSASGTCEKMTASSSSSKRVRPDELEISVQTSSK